jgi:hypothetical protein
MATTTHPRVHCASGSLTLTEVAANTLLGTIVVPPDVTRTITVVDGWLRAAGHSAAGATTLIIAETGGTPTTVVSATAGALTTDVIGRFGDTNITATNVGTACTKGRGLQVGCTGSALTTSHSLDYCIYYTVTV